jgi:hypothetical protein
MWIPAPDRNVTGNGCKTSEYFCAFRESHQEKTNQTVKQPINNRKCNKKNEKKKRKKIERRAAAI